MPNPSYWCLLSGGKDSVAAATTLALRGELAGCVFLDTGIALPDTKPFVCGLCTKNGWPLHVIKTTGDYDRFVRRYGFPGYSQHSDVMSEVKGRAIRQLRVGGILPRETILASGARRHESNRRGRTATEWGEWEGFTTYAPIFTWRDEQVWDFIRKNGLEVSPAYETLRISGDCICGAFAHPVEAHLLHAFYPEATDRLFRLESELAERPPKCDARRLRWGGGGGAHGAREQQQIESFCQGACEVP